MRARNTRRNARISTLAFNGARASTAGKALDADVRVRVKCTSLRLLHLLALINLLANC